MKQAMRSQPGWALPQQMVLNDTLSDCLTRVKNIYEFSLNAERLMSANLNAFKEIAEGA